MNAYETWVNAGLLIFVVAFSIAVFYNKKLRSMGKLFTFLAFVFAIELLRDLIFNGRTIGTLLSGVAFVVVLIAAIVARNLTAGGVTPGSKK